MELQALIRLLNDEDALCELATLFERYPNEPRLNIIEQWLEENGLSLPSPTR